MNPPGQYVTIGNHITYRVDATGVAIDCGSFGSAQRAQKLCDLWNSMVR